MSRRQRSDVAAADGRDSGGGRRARQRYERLAGEGIAATLALTLVRHGATVWNSTGRFQGSSDVELSKQGRDQAAAVARRLSGERIDRIYSSDLVRALETARIVAEPHGLDVTADSRLREFAFGEWEGLTWPQIVAMRPHLGETGATAAADYAPEGGETFADVAARLRSFIEDVRARADERVVLVTHAGPLHAALAVLEAAPDDGAGIGVSFSPGGLTRIAMERGRARLISLNDVRHLRSRG